MAWTERYVRADAAGGGNGTTDTNSGANGAWTLAEAITNEAAGIRLNVKVGTYASTTTTRTAAAAGTTTQPIWWRGFNTTPGDIDTDNTLTKPSFTFTTGRMVFSGAHHIISNIMFLCTGAVGAATLSITGGGWVDRCRAENQQANASASAINIATTGGAVITESYFKATTTATQVVQAQTGCEMSDCVSDGGVAGINCTSGTSTFRNSIVKGQTTDGIIANSSGQVRASQVTIYGGSNGIKFSTVSAAGNLIEACLFHSNSTAGINNATGTDTNNIKVLRCSSYNCGAATAGLGDAPVLLAIAETTDPVVNAAGGDFTLIDGALSRGVVNPFVYENSTLASYADRAAVQGRLVFSIPIE